VGWFTLGWSRLDPLARLRPQGPKWTKFRRDLYREWCGTPDCFLCGHTVYGHDRGTVEHRIALMLRPDLAWTRWWQGEPFLVPAHGGDFTKRGGLDKRCPVCGLNCNHAAMAPDAPRDTEGRSMPFSAGFIARKQKQSRRRRPSAIPAAPAPMRKPGRVW